jgi:hypothetical protein
MRISRAASITVDVFGAVMGVWPWMIERIERIGMASLRKGSHVH